MWPWSYVDIIRALSQVSHVSRIILPLSLCDSSVPQRMRLGPMRL